MEDKSGYGKTKSGSSDGLRKWFSRNNGKGWIDYQPGSPVVVNQAKGGSNARTQLADRRRLSATRLPEKERDQPELVGKNEQSRTKEKFRVIKSDGWGIINRRCKKRFYLRLIKWQKIKC